MDLQLKEISIESKNNEKDGAATRQRETGLNEERERERQRERVGE